MPLPILCIYESLQQYLMCYRDLLSIPQYTYFVIVLAGFIQCQQARTLSGLQRCVAQGGSLSRLSRFFARASWDLEALMSRWQERFRTQMRPVVQAELMRQQEEQPKRHGRAISTRRNRVSHWGRLDDAQRKGSQDGGHR